MSRRKVGHFYSSRRNRSRHHESGKGLLAVGFFILIILLSTIVGCAPQVYIRSQMHPEYNFQIDKKIFVALPENPTLTDYNFRMFLISELQTQGLKISDDLTNADLGLIFSFKEESHSLTSWFPFPISTETRGKITAYPYYGSIDYEETTKGSKIIPYSYDITVKAIFLSLYDLELVKNGNLIPVWEGAIALEKKHYDKYPQLSLRKLLEYYAQNFQGYRRLDIYSK